MLGFVKDGQIYVVAVSLSRIGDDVRGLLRHEIAMHALRLGKSDAEFQKIVQAFKGMASDKARAARAKVPNSTTDSLRDEEGLGYFIKANPATRLPGDSLPGCGHRCASSRPVSRALTGSRSYNGRKR